MEFKNEHLTRQSELLPEACLGEPITIIGAGAVGSWLTLALAKMGFGNISVWDDDDVSIENMNCQFYRHKDVGRKKVHATLELVYEFTGMEIEGHVRRFKSDSRDCPGIVVMAVDSMSARTAIWQAHKDRAPRTSRLIDPRMGAESALLYVMDPMNKKDQDAYEKTLYTDESAVFEPCTRKSTAYCALPLSGLVAAQIKSIVTEQSYSRITQWDIPKGAFMEWRH